MNIFKPNYFLMITDGVHARLVHLRHLTVPLSRSLPLTIYGLPNLALRISLGVFCLKAYNVGYWVTWSVIARMRAIRAETKTGIELLGR